MHPDIIYLASKSPRRRELLKQIGVHFELLMMREAARGEARAGEVDESPLSGEAPHAYVERVTLLKAASAHEAMRHRRLPVRAILAADTTVALGEAILGKPADSKEACAMLARLAGATHHVLTAVAVVFDGVTHHAVTVSSVSFARLSETDIKNYVAGGEPLDKAGAYGIQGEAAKFITHLAGSYSGVMGLPLFETAQLLRKAGIKV